jgi:L-seryl-tRNA(Ser) seleniumtransferase
MVQESIAAGSDLCCFSGDKLICGPQSGIIIGKGSLIACIRKSPFARMLRVCKLTLTALEATLCHFLEPTCLEREIPLYRMLARSVEQLDAQAHRLVAAIGHTVDAQIDVVDAKSQIGSGSVPDETLDSKAVALACNRLGPDELGRRLRHALPSVFGRIKAERLLLDMRTVGPEELDELAGAVQGCLR